MQLVIHQPIFPNPGETEYVKRAMAESYQTIMNDLPEKYQGYVENKDQ